MILIISQAKLEVSTERVIDWLEHYKGNFIRVNGDSFYNKDFVKSISFSNPAKSKHVDSFFEKIPIQYNIGWFRRWTNNEQEANILEFTKIPSNAIPLNNYLNIDRSTIRKYFFDSIVVKKWLSNPNSSSVSKLKQLKIAVILGLKIPNTKITNSKADLKKFLLENKEIICKDLTAPLILKSKNKEIIASQTFELTSNDIQKLPNYFYPTIFQKKIEKLYEIRTFFLNKKFYSMAIFSQNDSKTQVDFRNYNDIKPNRNVPYILPIKIETKLIELMDKLNLNTGSIDLIKNNDGDYIFLEVNPVGQFGMTSAPCNYQLEKLVAEYLLKNDY